MPRRIYTDGREFPTDEEPSFTGRSIGKWLDTDGDGRYDTLEVEPRNFKGPRTVEATGMPLHEPAGRRDTTRSARRLSAFREFGRSATPL